MDDLFWVLVVIFFVIAPAIEKVLKGGAGKGAPPGSRRVPPQTRTRTLPRPPAARPGAPGAGMPSTPRRTTPASEGAQDLLPADLWEVLTGQRPTQRPPEPPRPTDLEEDEEEEAREARPVTRAESFDELARASDVMLRRQQQQTAARQVDRSAPTIVSLETEPLPTRQRHAAFHRKVEGPAVVPAPSRAQAVDAADAVAGLLQSGDTNEIRRAILMQEILGPPRGLE